MTRAEEFEQLRPLLFAIAYRILGSVSEAEDAVQETFLRAWRRRDSFEGGPGFRPGGVQLLPPGSGRS